MPFFFRAIRAIGPRGSDMAVGPLLPGQTSSTFFAFLLLGRRNAQQCAPGDGLRPRLNSSVRAQVTLQHDSNFAPAWVTPAGAKRMLKLRPIFQNRERLAHIRRTVVIATVREAAPAKHVRAHPACCAAAVGALENWVSAWRHSGTCNAAENPSSAGFADVVFYRPCSSVHDLSPLSSLRSNPAFKPMALRATA